MIRKISSHIISLLVMLLMPTAILISQAPSTYNVVELSFNDKFYSDMASTMTLDGIIFCSDRRTSGLVNRLSFDERHLYNLWFAKQIDSTKWDKPIEIITERSSLFNNGPVSISKDGSTVLFTSEVEVGKVTKNRKYKNHSGLFFAELQGEELVNVQPFKYNSTDYDIAHPSLSDDGKYLYFASNMPGGKGGSDIWYTEMKDGEWSEPVNLGDKVNTLFTENYPFIHESGRVYFSSNRREGSGALDIYYVIKDKDGSWETPVHLPEPINSSFDDFAFVAGKDAEFGYFTSNREKSDDIYSFISTIIRKISCDSLEYNNYCYEFSEENASKYDTIPFRYEWEFGDGEKGNGIVVDHCYPGPGRYVIKLNVENLVTGEIKMAEKTYRLDIEDIEQAFITSADTAGVGEAITLDAKETNLPGWDIARYYWNFDDETIAEGENVEKMWSRPGVYDIQLIVTSREDANGVVNETCVGKKIVIE